MDWNVCLQCFYTISVSLQDTTLCSYFDRIALDRLLIGGQPGVFPLACLTRSSFLTHVSATTFWHFETGFLETRSGYRNCSLPVIFLSERSSSFLHLPFVETLNSLVSEKICSRLISAPPPLIIILDQMPSIAGVVSTTLSCRLS